eukprot:597791_1
MASWFAFWVAWIVSSQTHQPPIAVDNHAIPGSKAQLAHPITLFSLNLNASSLFGCVSITRFVDSNTTPILSSNYGFDFDSITAPSLRATSFSGFCQTCFNLSSHQCVSLLPSPSTVFTEESGHEMNTRSPVNEDMEQQSTTSLPHVPLRRVRFNAHKQYKNITSKHVESQPYEGIAPILARDDHQPQKRQLFGISEQPECINEARDVNGGASPLYHDCRCPPRSAVMLESANTPHPSVQTTKNMNAHYSVEFESSRIAYIAADFDAHAEVKMDGLSPLRIAYKPHIYVEVNTWSSIDCVFGHRYAIDRGKCVDKEPCIYERGMESIGAGFGEELRCRLTPISQFFEDDVPIRNTGTRNDRIWFVFMNKFIRSKMYFNVMIVLRFTTIWLLIKSLNKRKTTAFSFRTTRLFIMSLINSKACLLVLIALTFRSTKCTLSIGTSRYHTCALLTTPLGFNGVKCWGKGDYGCLGYENEHDIGDGLGPYDVTLNEMGALLPLVDMGINDADIIQLTTGYRHTCALTDTGKVKCWGDGVYLGYGSQFDKGDAPNTMGSNLPFIDFGAAWFAIQIAAQWYHTCALLNDGTTPNVMKCFGYNGYGGLGYGIRYYGTLDDDYRGNEANEMGDDLPVIDLGTGFNPMQITAGKLFTCALSSANKVKCFGRNNYGQLGIGNNIDRPVIAEQMGDNLTFVDLGTAFTPIQITSGYSHSCALSDAGDVKCWGFNGNGELGYGNTINRGWFTSHMGDNLPIVDLGSNLTTTQITAGSSHTCALFSIGDIKCWGYWIGSGYDDSKSRGNNWGEMGDNLPFVDLGSLGYAGEVVEVKAGGYHTCASFSSDELKCFGESDYGVLGLGYALTHDIGVGYYGASMGDYLPIVDLGFPSSSPTTFPTSSPSKPSTSPTDIPTSQTSNPSASPSDIPSSQTINPSSSPTKYPTSNPTSQTYFPTTQTNDPSSSPTYIPTSQTNNPSLSPTRHPTSYPTSQTDLPTSQTKSPSFSPTDIPTSQTNYPSLIPTRHPTSNPTSPTDFPTSQTNNPSSSPTSLATITNTVLVTSYEKLHDEQLNITEDWNNIGYGIISVLLIIPALLVLVGLLYHRKQEGSDSPNYVALVRCFTNIADLYTDTVFCASLLVQPDEEEVILGVIAAVFTLVPHFCSIVICLQTLQKWRQKKAFKYYVEKYDGLIIGITAIAGFYPSVDLLSSKLFHLKQTALHIDQAEFFRLKQLRFFNTILLENLPLMCIQIYLIAMSTSMDEVPPITILAFVFSSLSLTVGLLTMVSRAWGNQDGSTSALADDQMFYKMNLQSKAFESRHRFIHSIFAKVIALCLGIERNRVETASIIPILNGITVTFSIKSENNNEQIKLDKELKEIVSNMTLDATAHSDDAYDLKALLAKYLKVKDLRDLKSDVETLSPISCDNTLPLLTDAVELGKVEGDTIGNSSETK